MSGKPLLEEPFQRIWVSQFNTFYPDYLVFLSLSGVPLLGTKAQKAQIISNAKKSGLIPGIPDLSIMAPNGIVIHLEFKRMDGTGIQSPDQKDVEAKLIELGHNYYIIEDYQDAWQAVADHTTTADRRAQYNKVVADFIDKQTLTKQFLHYPVGTSVDTITADLKLIYLT